MPVMGVCIVAPCKGDGHIYAQHHSANDISGVPASVTVNWEQLTVNVYTLVSRHPRCFFDSGWSMLEGLVLLLSSIQKKTNLMLKLGYLSLRVSAKSILELLVPGRGSSV